MKLNKKQNDLTKLGEVNLTQFHQNWLPSMDSIMIMMDTVKLLFMHNCVPHHVNVDSTNSNLSTRWM